MKAFKLDYLGKDKTLVSLGSLFRKTGSPGHNRWNINTGFQPDSTKQYTAFHDAPVLAKKRKYNSKEVSDLGGWNQEFRLKNSLDWQVKAISEFPDGKTDGYARSTKCFVFTIDAGITVFMPQFELARVLFFHNGYLAESALDPNALNLDFDVTVDESEEWARINIIPGSGYSADYLETESDRNLLSWILLEPEARRLYRSISSYQYNHAVEANGYRKWDFQFDVPQFVDINFSIRGRFTSEHKALLIYEIKEMQNLPANMPIDIDVFHEDFALTVKENTGKGGVEEVKPNRKTKDMYGASGDIDIDLQTKKENTRSSGLKFARKFKAVKVPNKKRSISNKSPVEKDQNGSATQKPIIKDRAGTDRNNANDLTDHKALYEDKFRDFLEMLKHLQRLNANMVISTDPHRLPRMPGYSKFMLNSGDKPRYIADVKIRLNGVELHLLEVDTSDGNSLSVKIIRVEVEEKWEDHLKKIESRLIKRSLKWPSKAYFDDLVGHGRHTAIEHKIPPKGEKLSVDKIKRWAEICYGELQELSRK